MEEFNAGTIDTTAVSTGETSGTDTPAPETTTQPEIVARTFTQDEVNAFVKERLDRANANWLKKLGLESSDGLDDFISRANGYNEMKELSAKHELENNNLRTELSFIKNNVNENRYEDIKTYFKGKELELTEDNLKQELATHPEWLKVQPKTTTIKQFSSHEPRVRGYDDTAAAEKMFGIKFAK